MPTEKVIAYFMHEPERESAEKVLAGSTSTESFVVGDIDTNEIPALEAQGLIVRPAASPVPTSQQTAAPGSTSALIAGSAGWGATANLEAVQSALPQPVDFYRVQLRGPLIEAWREQLLQMGITLIARMKEGGYKAKLRAEQVGPLKSEPFVASVKWIEPETPVIPSALERLELPGQAPEQKKFDVRLNLPSDLPVVLDWLSSKKITVLGSRGRKIRLLTQENNPELGALSALPEVDNVVEYVEPVLYNDLSRQLIGVEARAGAPPFTLSQDGTGETVGIADTGIDSAHPDFAGRIVSAIARGRAGDTSDPNGHGTHVAGSLLGDGTASGGQFRGVAPRARLVMQSLLDAGGGLGGLPLDLNDLFDEAYAAGVRVHNNSWGADTSSKYVINSEEVDEAASRHRDMLIVFAAGNAGSAANRAHSDPGYVDWLSIGSPGSSKNALTVGASRSCRTDGPLNGTTYGQAWPIQFPDPPIRDESISGDPGSMAGFSSRGPCDDRRIKPDLVAPGTEICSTKSSTAPAGNFNGVNVVHSQYAYDSGTSMAAPLVAGCATLVRQYFTAAGHQPSAALLKATLINGTEWLSGPSSIANPTGIPNFHQGHGRVNLVSSIPNPSNPLLALRFVDDWRDVTKSLSRTGDRRRFQVTLPTGVPAFRVCLAYNDLPARALQNNLNLLVQDPTGKKWMGNSQLPQALVLPDPDNNVETVNLTNASAGVYYIQVFAGNILQGPQDFALVATANGLPPLNEI